MSSRNRAIVRFDSTSATTSTSTATATTTTSTNASVDGITRDQLDQYVRDGVKYLLIVDHKKIPIKRSDLFKNISNNSYSRNQQELILENIAKHLSQTFGIDLVECPHLTNSYILVNKLSIDGFDNNCIEECQHFRSALLSIILSNIFMCGQSVIEHDLYKFLAKLGLDINSKQQLNITDELSGVTLKKLITEVWVRQQYLKFEKLARSEPPVHEFSWGFRATQEFNKIHILKFVSKVYGNNITPKYWRNQYQSAINELQVEDHSSGDGSGDDS